MGYLHAVAAAAGCSLSQPFPDNGIDWHVSHSAPGHTVDDEVTIKVQLKCTYQIPPHPPGPTFSFTLDNAHLVKLARTPVSVHKILVVMLVPAVAGRLAARRPRPARPAALLLLDQPGRPPGDGPAQDHRADPDLADLRRPGALRDHDPGRGGRETLMHRPTGRAPARPRPTAATRRDPGTGTGAPRPRRGRPRRPRRAAAPARLAAARRSRRALRPLDPARARRRAAPACSCPRAAPSPTATTCSARPSPRWPAAPRPPPARCWSASPCPATRSAGGATCPQGPPGAAAWTGRRSSCARAARQMLLAGALAARGRPATTAPGTGGTAQASLESVLVGRRARRPQPDRLRARRHRPGRSPYASTRPCTPPARPSTTSAPPAAWRPSTRRRGGRQPRADRGARRPGPRHRGRPDRRSSGRPPPESPRAAPPRRRARRVLARRPARAARGGRPLPARRARPCRYGSPARWSGCAAPGRAATGTRTAAGARRAPRSPHVRIDPRRGGVPDRGPRPPGRAAGPGAGPAGEPGRLPAADRTPRGSRPCRWTRRSGTG